MSRDNKDEARRDVSRRDVLRTTGGALAATGLAGKAAAEDGNDTVRVNVGFSNRAGRRAARDAADQVHREFGFRAMTIDVPRSARQGLRNNPNIRYVEEDGEMQALQTTPYGIETTDADVAIDDGNTGDGVSVAILDTGIDAIHETLEENLGEGWAANDAACQADCDGGWGCSSADIDTCYAEWDDDNDHGSHVAGTAGAADNGEGVLGVAPDATLHAVKVLDCCGSGSFSDIAAGIEWSADQGHDVQNMSLGSDTDSDVVADALEYAASQGVVLVAAAGNDGPCSDCVGFPARHEEVIAVSATDENDDLADFSSTGPEVELAAPGADVLSAIPRNDYAELSGTSMASPHVAGAAATVIADGTTDREAVRAELKEAADDIDLDDNEQGAGRLNVADAVDADEEDDDDDDEDDDEDCVDAENWPAGTGTDGYEYITQVDLDGQVVESSGNDAYYDFTCPDIVTVEQGESFELALEYDDSGYDNHYANVFVDWDQNEDWSTAEETVVFENESDDSVTHTATVDVPEDAELGGTLLRVRLSWDGFDDPDATGEFGEVNDFTVYVEEPTDDGDEDCVDAENWPAGTGTDGDEHITQVDLDGQVVESSGDGAYYDFTCPDVVTVQQGGSFDIALEYDDGGYDSHYANVFVDWDQNEDWSTAEETAVFENESDDSVTHAATVDVPGDAEPGSTLLRVRLSWNSFDDPDATGEFGEVNDFTVHVE